MNDISVVMGIVDIIPVVIFLITNLMLMNALSNKLSYNKFAILSSGVYMLFFGGVCKILWKFLYALGICDYVTLTECFFPMQSIGFILLCVGVGSAVFAKKLPKNNTAAVCSVEALAVIPVVTTHMPFLLVTLIAMTCFHIILAIGSVKLKEYKEILYIVLSYAGMLCNCFIGVASNGSDEAVAIYHWIAELSHIFAEVFLLLCVRHMVKHGLKNKNAFVKEA